MFEEFGPEDPPLPPAGALEQAMNRGRKIRRQRRAGVVSGVAVGAALIGGITLASPFHTNRAVAPVDRPVTPRDYSPIPANPALSGRPAGLDFGTLSKVTAKNGVVTLHVDRSMFYMGDEVKDHPGEFAQDVGYSIEDTDGKGKDLTFTLDPNAVIRGHYFLKNTFDPADAPKIEKLTVEDFIRNAQRAQTDGDEVMLWLRHADGPDGPVTAITEQAVP
jgi:hypothetical protein